MSPSFVGGDCTERDRAPDSRIAHAALEADGFRFDASDLMPPEVGAGAFWTGMTRVFLEGPDAIEEIMADIERAWSALEEAE